MSSIDLPSAIPTNILAATESPAPLMSPNLLGSNGITGNYYTLNYFVIDE